MLMSLMATELSNGAKELHIRQAAGLVLKNCLTSKVRSARRPRARLLARGDGVGPLQSPLRINGGAMGAFIADGWRLATLLC